MPAHQPAAEQTHLIPVVIHVPKLFVFGTSTFHPCAFLALPLHYVSLKYPLQAEILPSHALSAFGASFCELSTQLKPLKMQYSVDSLSMVRGQPQAWAVKAAMEVPDGSFRFCSTQFEAYRGCDPESTHLK